MEKSNQKKALVLSIVDVITLIAVVVGTTFAYFTAQGGGTGNINVNANTATTDNLSFQVGEPISLSANQEDFGSGAGNKTGSTFARVILTANNATNNAIRNYYVYLEITSNDFEYTTVDEQAELLLKVTDPTGAEVESIPGLEIKKQTGYEETMPIGLMYVSDFGYAISPEDWDKAMSTEYSRVNRLFGGYDWFISPNTGDFGGAYSVDGGTDGTVSPQYVNSGNELPSNDIRPTFYLNSDVQYVSGDGSQQNPYRIA